MANILMRQAHKLPYTKQYIEEKRRIYNLILDQSFEDDSVFVSASNQLKRLDR
jgi:hypothetical protein